MQMVTFNCSPFLLFFYSNCSLGYAGQTAPDLKVNQQLLEVEGQLKGSVEKGDKCHLHYFEKSSFKEGQRSIYYTIQYFACIF